MNDAPETTPLDRLPPRHTVAARISQLHQERRVLERLLKVLDQAEELRQPLTYADVAPVSANGGRGGK